MEIASSPKPVRIVTSGLLFDLDGTLLASPRAIKCFWEWYAAKEGLSAAEIMSDVHGRRTIEVLQIHNPKDATKEKCSELEALIPGKWSYLAEPVPGVHRLLKDLANTPKQWGVVTSGTRSLAEGWFNNFLHVQIPQLFVTSEDVSSGKPDPEPYLEGKSRLGLSEDFVVFEDAIAGTISGKRAGGRVIALATTNTPESLKNVGADLVINDLRDVVVKDYDSETKKLTLDIYPTE